MTHLHRRAGLATLALAQDSSDGLEVTPMLLLRVIPLRA